MRAWFKATLGEGILWVEGQQFPSAFLNKEMTWALPRPEGTRSPATRSCSSSKVNQSILPFVIIKCLNFESQQSVRQLTHVFFETSVQLASQWSRIVEKYPEDRVEIEITNWAGRFA